MPAQTGITLGTPLIDVTLFDHFVSYLEVSQNVTLVFALQKNSSSIKGVVDKIYGLVELFSGHFRIQQG